MGLAERLQVDRQILKRFQIARFAIVGLISNAILYVAYLILTFLGLGHKTTMSMLFAVGVTQTFFLNRRWTFGHSGSTQRAYVRYWVAYGIAYFLDLIMLALFVDLLGYKHQIVQGLLAIVIAAMMFFLQKFWVFRDDHLPAPNASKEMGRE